MKKSSTKKSRVFQEENVVVLDDSSSDNSEHETICYGMVPQELGRPRLATQKSSISRITFVDAPEALSVTSITSSITR